MRKKFTYLISLAVAMICSSGSVAWGQMYWDNGCDCGDGSLGTYYPGCNTTITIDGQRYINYYNDTKANFTSDAHTAYPQVVPYETGACDLSDGPLTKITYWVETDGTIKKTIWDRGGWHESPSYNCGINLDECCNDGEIDYTARSTDPVGTIFNVPGCWEWNPSHAHTPIDVVLSTVATNLVYVTPTWKHTPYTWSFSTSTGVSTWSAGTTSTGNVTEGKITTSGNGLRLTGGASQVKKTGSIPTSTFIIDGKRLLFDKDWDASWNGVSNVSPWDPKVNTGTGTLGFYSTTAAVTKSGGTLVLGPCQARGTITVNTDDADLTVDSYTHEAYSYLDCDETIARPGSSIPGQGIVYNDSASYCYGNGLIAKTKISTNELKITNTWGGCWAVNFPEDFNPGFTGDGRLLINPNVANFNAGVTLTTSKAGNVDIFAKKTTTTGDFKYTSTGSGNLHVFMNIPQSPDCLGCGYFITTGAFTTDISGATAGSIMIDDNITGYVEVGGNYTHIAKQTLASSHNVNVDGSIYVGGNTELKDAEQDVIEFTSASSAIHFGATSANYFYYKNFTTGNGSLLVQANGACDGEVCDLGGGDVLFSGPVSTIQQTTTGTGFVNIQSTNSGVTLNEGLYSKAVHTPFTINGNLYVEIKKPYSGSETVKSSSGATEGAYIERAGDGNDTIISPAGFIKVEKPFTYNQTTAGAGTGLVVKTEGLICAPGCDGNPMGSYIKFDDAVTTHNVTTGTTKIRSDNDRVMMSKGFAHQGVDNNMLVYAGSSVKILGTYPNATTVALSPVSTLPQYTNAQQGVYIDRKGKGEDEITARDKFIHVAMPFTYEQSGTIDGNGLTVHTLGSVADTSSTLCADDCNNEHGRYILFDKAVSTENIINGGYTTIQSNVHHVTMNEGYVHQGVDGNLLISGNTAVNINNAYPKEATYLTSGSGLSLPLMAVNATGTLGQEGVYISRTGAGADEIKSANGHVNVTDPFSYVQTALGGSTTNGLYVWANGICSQSYCDGFVGGYVWLRNDVNTVNLQTGPTTIESKQHYVRIGENLSPTNNYDGGHFTHTGVNGDLNVLAGTVGTCYTACPPNSDGSPDALLTYTGEHARRGYVWINDDVNITMSGTPGIEGNAVVRSYGDIVQMDDSVTYTDATGANLWVEGSWGVRTLGPTALTNVAYANTGDGTSSPEAPLYPTAGQGFVTYYSPNGHVDFGVAPNIGNDNPDVLGGNTPFKYTATVPENALLIEGNTRVFFGDSVTIAMGPAGTNGDAKIYSKEGWIKFADTVGYTGTAGNLNIYADGGDNNMSDLNVFNRSCMNPALTCADYRGGFVLFDSITNIEVSDKGVTWIRSNNDDVVIGDMFTYTNTTTDPANGEFVMQAGQDIYGRNVYKDGHHGQESDLVNNMDYSDTILFDQHGDKSVLLEAKKTIHIQQMLLFKRTGTAAGDITLKAGYPTFSEPSLAISGQPASAHEATPSADLAGLDWTAEPIANCIPNDYASRFSCTDPRNPGFTGAMQGGDIWFEDSVMFDLADATTNKIMPVTLRAMNSIFIDSTLVYNHEKSDPTANVNNVLLFAETGNVEAAVTRQNSYGNNKLDKVANPGYIADDSVVFNMDPTYVSELRIQAGNQPTNINAAPTNFAVNNCWWKLGCTGGAEFDGNILFNKPLFIHNAGKDESYTLLSAARDIETQVMAPFTFDYSDATNPTHGDLLLTAGRHIETHAMMKFDYPNTTDDANITMQAGRLKKATMTGNDALCKANEAGTTLTDKDDATKAFDPDVETGGVYGSKNNEFAESGSGNGSILMFDSVEFNYEGSGKILMTALNGNIESDPYLHRVPNEPANPGLTIAGNAGAGYMPYLGYPRSTPSNPLQHDAQLTFNHKGTGITRLEAIDIKLHDKIAYYDSVGTLTTTLLADFGKLEINSYDSILTRNLEYVNHNGDQNLEITSDKYKLTDTDCSGQTCPDNECYMDGNGAIQQGHIVLGYGADWITTDDDRKNMNDSIVINFAGNQFTAGANALIKAGYKGFSSNKVKGTTNSNLFVAGLDKGKAYGGNITFDYMKVDMAKGNHTSGGYMEISTPNGNIWGKDSINYRGVNGDLLVDAGLGSIEDLDAIRWNTGGTEAVGGVNNNGNYVPFENSSSCINGKENTLNTNVPGTCDSSMWRTGNIMMKGGSLNFNDSVNGNVAGTGNATFRTREGFIDTYDAFTVDSMQGDLLKYAGTMNSTSAATNEWGDISERDFEYHQVENSGSIFYGADDNIMMNYGYSNGDTKGGEAYEGRGEFDLATGKLADTENPFYSTTYKPSIDAGRSIYNVNRNGYLWYRTEPAKIWMNGLHKLYRGCTARTTAQTGVCSPITGECMTIGNYARDLMFNFDTTAVDGKTIMTGGLGMVATNFIDMFTKFTYFGGQGSGMGSVPGMSSLHGESVSGYGLYLKSQFDGQKVEKRRATCQDCDKKVSFPMEDKSTEATYEWTYIGFHDDARIYTQDQKGLIEAPVIEFFGHAELNPYMAASGKGDPGEGNLTLKGDSLIFHDSAIFDGTNLILTPYTTGEQRQNDMRYGVINDVGKTSNYYKNYGPAIQMPDRNTPILEFGYQRCNEPPKAPQKAPNARSKAGLEATPMVGGDVIISFQHNFSLPIYNTIVANNARISFISDSLDAPGGEYVDTYIRTDLLRIRNKVEFYTGQNEFGKDGNNPKNRSGKFRLSSTEYQEAMDQGTGIFPRHLHMEPGSELSIPGEDTMKIHSMTTAGGYGIIHENISVVANGTIAPGYASLMECDCQSPHRQGQLTVHNLTMEKDAIFRISIGNNNPCYDEDGNIVSNHCTATDTLTVLDSIWFNGKIPVHILPETEELDPGCYLFLDYGDSLGVTPEYVKNFTLPIDRFQDHYFGFDYSTPGKVYLCVMEFPQPIVQRYVKLPAVEGVTTTPNAGTHYVSGHQDFSFTAKYSGTPLKVTATGYYHGGPIDLDQTATILPDGSYQYTIFQVVQPYDVEFGPEISSVQVGNDYIGAPLVYAYKNTLHINVDKEDIVSIYNMTGVLYKKIEVPAGNSKFTLDRGMYVVTLKDGSVYKIVIK